MKLEEKARAALAEAKYKQHLEQKMKETHELEGENLELDPITNMQRDFQTEETVPKKKGGKGKGNKLSRELRRISYQ
jgi:hypothetical protein